MKTTLRTTVSAIMLAGTLFASFTGISSAAQTPQAVGCATVATPAADMAGMNHGAMNASTPEAGMAGMDHGDMGMGTPTSTHEVDFDLMYIDMMIPHHESVIALAEVAQYELTDPRLIAMAEAIVATQDAEIDQLMQLRQAWYGDADTVSMEQMHSMPGMSGDMAGMEQQMSAEWQVQNFCAADNKDLAFIEQVLPHHQMAVDTSVPAFEHAVHPELKEIAAAVIEAQQAEIDTLNAIYAELTGEATPEP